MAGVTPLLAVVGAILFVLLGLLAYVVYRYESAINEGSGFE